ncbi:MAG: DinB family protein [Actinomycetota bacterium]|nr:DinB family protein [Actinomycetota bacterium]
MTDEQTDEYGRPDTPLAGSEIDTLLGFLDYQRATMAWKCRGLSDEQLRVALPPTTMSLGGMLMHLARVEDNWFTETVGEAERTEPWAAMAWAAEWEDAAVESGDNLRGLWSVHVERSRRVVAAQLASSGDALESTYPAWGGQARVSLRWVLVHMIEEYARHNGHADLLRQSIDGETGE